MAQADPLMERPLQMSSEAPPANALRAVCRPTLKIDGQYRRTGTAFLLRDDNIESKRLLVMAQHLAGMANTTSQVPWQEMPLRARSASCRSLLGDETWQTGPAFAIAGAHAMGPLMTLNDLAAFPVQPTSEGAQTVPLQLSMLAPKAGDLVWLVAETADAYSRNQHFYAATVISSPTPNVLAYQYHDMGLDLSNTSGAPIVNEQGYVIGVNVAVTRADGATIGIADDLETIRADLTGISSLPAHK